MSRINPEKFDWERIEKALQVESEYGYKNIQGKLYRFSEFLCLTFGDTPPSQIFWLRFVGKKPLKNSLVILISLSLRGKI